MDQFCLCSNPECQNGDFLNGDRCPSCGAKTWLYSNADANQLLAAKRAAQLQMQGVSQLPPPPPPTITAETPRDARLRKARAEQQAFREEKASILWFLLPTFFSLVGGVIGYFLLKPKSPQTAKQVIIVGCLAFCILAPSVGFGLYQVGFVLSVIICLVFMFLMWRSKTGIARYPPPPPPPPPQ
jgi:hypothetical protein